MKENFLEENDDKYDCIIGPGRMASPLDTEEQVQNSFGIKVGHTLS